MSKKQMKRDDLEVLTEGQALEATQDCCATTASARIR